MQGGTPAAQQQLCRHLVFHLLPTSSGIKIEKQNKSSLDQTGEGGQGVSGQRVLLCCSF